MLVADMATRVYAEMGKALVGQSRAVEQSLVALLADGHCLLQGVPGLGKTLLVRALSQVMSLEFKRIQFTPDLMPSDVIGTNIFDQKTSDFSLRKGPIFTSILLADEINRTPPKTQAALLEAMEERQATIDGVRYELPKPFIVFATQNPIEYEGTYPLPEAQQDRFLFKIVMDYPGDEQEVDVLRRFHAGFRSQKLEEANIQPILDLEALEKMKAEVREVKMEDRMFRYIYDIVRATRSSGDLLVGGSPRAGLALVSASQALAAIRGRDFVIPDDIKELAMPVLRHRVLLKPEAEIEGHGVEQVLQRILDAQVVPR
ncbi:MAG: MoxR family ATPase [Fimbriimonadaceae bacterium]|nr:MAG: MoxR family ATPase [Fimbriimonadaceae bacterium]